MDASALLTEVRLLPVVTIHDADLAIPLANALVEAGVSAIEITLRTAEGFAAIGIIAHQVPNLLVGVGSVQQPDQFVLAKQQGAQFAVSPGATPTLLDAANMPYVPAAATPSECLALLEKGYYLQKFFPASLLGGPATLSAWRAPIPEAKFCVSGGVNQATAPEYLTLPNVATLSGSWFINDKDLVQRRFEKIYDDAKLAMSLFEN